MVLITKKDLEDRERRELSPWATLSGESRGRRRPEKADPFRTCFLRDRDRLLHSAAFRRLQQKTQVLCVAEGDHYRTRLTHTLEVSQMSHSIAVALGLNADLAQAVALGHDLGHPPFGHAGERTLAELLAHRGGFNHNAQAVRLVDHLEHRTPAYPGLNLSFETRLSLLKRPPPADFPLEPDMSARPPGPTPIEAKVVDLADAAAYLHHDLDDALRTGLVALPEVEQVALWRQAREELAQEGRSGPGHGLVTQVLARMIKRVNQDIIFETGELMKLTPPTAPPPPPRHSDRVATLLAELKAFLTDRFYRHHRVMEVMAQGGRVLEQLFKRFTAKTGEMPERFRELIPRWGPERAVCDYLAGMTDRYALSLAGQDPETYRAVSPGSD